MGSTGIDYGRRLLPVVVDDLSRNDPGRVYAATPRSSNVEDGFQDVTYQRFAKAIDRAAWWLEGQIGKSDSFETLAYSGPSDIRYPIVAFAAVKVGYKALFTSSRNSVEGNLALFESTQCKTFMTAKTMVSPLVKACLAKRPMKYLGVPDLVDWLKEGDVSIYPYEKTYAAASTEPFVVLHTSGSTGLPKAIDIPQGSLAVLDAYNMIPDKKGSETMMHQFLREQSRIFCAMPAFHAAGIFMLIAFPIFYGVIPVMPLPEKPMSADLANSMLVHGKIQRCLLPPSLLEDISKVPAFLRNLKNVPTFYGGGPLSKGAGDVVCGRTKLMSFLGSTEAMLLPTMMVDQEDWQYTKFSPYTGAEFRHHSEDLYELFLVRRKDLDLYQGIFRTFPDLQEYSMHDLFSKHPTKPDLWLYRGRADDVIVFANGEKLNPVSMEQRITDHPEVRAALVFGQARFQTALLVEPHDPALAEEHKGKLIESIWPVVEKANSECPAHGRLSKSLIMFTTPAKPMLRAGKGTIQRQLTLRHYSKEIDSLYTASDPAEEDVQLNTRDFDTIAASLRDIIEHTTKLESLGIEDDFFQHGMDSLQVLQIVRKMKAALAKNGANADMVTSSTIYMHPSVASLSDAILKLLDPFTTDEVEDESLKMQASLNRWSSDLPGRIKHPYLSVILTGSTGSLGSYLLDVLLTESKVVKIYCLNRSKDAAERQARSNSSRGLTTDWGQGRVVFLQSDMSKPHFGLQQDDYEELAQSVTHIVHNAWAVDFNHSLESFEGTHVEGVRRFIDFSIQSTMRAQIFFTSSISSVMNWSANHKGLVPEQIIEDFTVPQPMGYAESKHISERLLAVAGKVSNVPSSVCRVGQVAGPVGSDQGMWNKQEWFPTIVASSAYLGMLPESLMAMGTEWVPVDILAKIIVELLDPATDDDAASEEITRVYHTVNPQSAEWKHLLPAVKTGLETKGKPIKIVSFRQWVDALEQSASKTEDVAKNPAIKLLAFFQGLEQHAGRATAQLETRKTVAQSKTLKGLGPVSPEWMTTWMRQWNF